MLRLLSQILASILSLALGFSACASTLGNRQQLASTLAPVPAGLWNYDANDRFTAGDTYDNNGNTVSSGGIANTYDFENHLIQKAGVTIVYDGDGNRVSKTVAGVTTTYLVDTLNPTGYAQVVYESFSGNSSGNREQNHIFIYGLELISQVRSYLVSFNGKTQRIYYVYDGHGSVRALTDPTGAVTDTYDYDAFGNLLHSTGTTPNNYLFSGEQFDPDLHLYYNRARYLNVTTGRFWTMDTFEGDASVPISLHKYLYASTDPVNRVDPEGQEDADVSSNLISASGQTILATIAIVSAVAAVCTIDYELGRDDCFDRNPDRERTFYHGTTLLDAQEVVQNQAFNVVRKIARQKNPSILDFGSGLYMTDSLQTAGIFAGVQGFDVREGGPAVVRVDITQRNWRLLVLEGAVDSSPITGLGGHSQVFVPFFLVPRLDYLKQNYSLISPPFD
jgi:RHS repeat-associated protein